MSWFEYIIRWFDQEKSDETINCGITYAHNMIEAMENIGSYYGTSYIFTVKIHELDDFSCFDFADYKEDSGSNRFFEVINVTNKVQL